MASLNFQPPDLKRKRLKSLPVVWSIGIISIVSVAVVGFTLATPVTRNIVSSSSEFGQGMTVTTGCAGSTPLTLIPRATFRNTGSRAGSYYLTGLTLSNIPSSCDNSFFQFNAYGPTGDALRLTNCSYTGTTPVMYFNGSLNYDGWDGVTPTYFTNYDMYTQVSSASPTSFTIDWDDSVECGGSAPVDPASLSKIVVQTSSDCSQVPLGGITKEVGAQDSGEFMVSNVEGLYVGEPIASCSLGMGDTITSISGPESNTDPEYGSSFPLGSPVYFVYYTHPGLHVYYEPTEEIMHFGVNAP